FPPRPIRSHGPVMHVKSCGACTLRECLQQRLGLLEVSRVKTLGEPAVDRRQERAGFSALALLLPQAAQAGRSPEFQRLCLLAAGDVESLAEAGFRLCGSVRR